MAKVMLVDDEMTMVQIVAEMLRGEGHEVIPHTTADSAFAALEETAPELVITDMMMPRMGGFPVLEFLKEMPDETRPKVIMVTANEGGRHKAYAEMLGVDDYIRKPFAMDVLLDAIERILGKPAPTARRKPKAPGGQGPIQRRS